MTKFNYLKGVLGGKAADCVKGLMLTSSNYEKACTILQDRFAEPQVVITANMDVLKELNAVPSAKDVLNTTGLDVLLVNFVLALCYLYNLVGFPLLMA